jgi:hypothetical protein
MGQIGSSETLISNNFTSLNNPKDGRILFNLGRSLRPSVHQLFSCAALIGKFSYWRRILFLQNKKELVLLFGQNE